MNFPTIPENWESLSAAELRDLARQIREAFQALGDNPTAEEREVAMAAIEARQALLAEARSKEAFESVEMSEDEDADPEVEETDGGDDGDGGGDDAGDDAGDGEDLSGKAPAIIPSGLSLGATEDNTDPSVRPDVILAKAGISGRAGGQAFDGWADLASALVEVAETLSPGSSAKIPVGYIEGKFAEHQILGENMIDNLRMFDRDEVMAAFCAPPTPIYDMSCWNTDRRPVRNSLPQFRPDARGSVSIFPSPSLSDITDQSPAGVGTWTTEDDDSQTGTDPAVKECAVIECGTPTSYSMYGVWRCITIQNLLAMTFPELVEAWLNRLAAAHARLAETQLLEGMGSGATAVAGETLGYGAAISVTSQILELLALHQERERWDGDEMEGWLPRWVRYAMKMDLMRRRNTSGTVRVPTDAEIDQMFRNVGVNPHWFIDRPSWAAAIPAPVSGGNKNNVPDTIDILLAPRGKFGVIDRGQLTIGVTGNNIYRDNQSNAHNNFTMFFENFEGIVNTDNCPAYLFELPNLCYNGVQIDDLVLACDGTDAGT